MSRGGWVVVIGVDLYLSLVFADARRLLLAAIAGQRVVFDGPLDRPETSERLLRRAVQKLLVDRSVRSSPEVSNDKFMPADVGVH